MKMSSAFMRIKVIFIKMVSHLIRLALKQRHKGTRKWHIKFASFINISVQRTLHFSMLLEFRDNIF